jgi:hypothetical protein
MVVNDEIGQAYQEGPVFNPGYGNGANKNKSVSGLFKRGQKIKTAENQDHPGHKYALFKSFEIKETVYCY